MSDSLSMPHILEPEDLSTGNTDSAETRSFDAGAKFNGSDTGRLFAHLVVGTWDAHHVEDPHRDERNFDGASWLFSDPATARRAADILRDTADQLDTAARYMDERIRDLVAAEKRDKQGRIDYLRTRAVLARKQEEALAEYHAETYRHGMYGDADALHAAIMAAGQGAG